jgi:hypothetical protein
VTLSSNAIVTDTVTLNYTSASFADKDVGTAKPVAVSGISIGGADAGNYNLLNTSANTAADITPFEVTVNAHAKTKFVGQPDPALTYSATPSLFSGDMFTGALTRAPGEAVGQYPIQQGTLSAGSNYTITFVSANLTIVSATVKTLNSVAAHDGWVLETGETSNQGGTVNPTAAVFLLGDTANKQQYRAILSFSTASLPDNAVITRVTLKIKRQSLVGINPFTTHGKIAIDIRKGAFSNAAALQPTDFQAGANKPGVGLITNTPRPGGWYVAKLASTAHPYINRAGLTQFRLRFQKDDDNDAIVDLIRFYSGNTAAANRPVLVIEYYVP